MKRNLICAAYAVLLLFSPLALGYVIYFVDKESDPACFNDPKEPSNNMINIFVGKDEDSWGRYIRGARAHFTKLRELATKSTEPGEISAPVISAELERDLLLSQEGDLFNKLIGRQLNARLLQDAGIIAVHKNVPRGNAGNRATFNWNSLEKEYRLLRGSKLYMTIVDKKNKEIILLNIPFRTDEKFKFIVKKDPAIQACKAMPVNFEDPGVEMPAGPALRDKDFVQEWIKRAHSELIPEYKRNNDPRLVKLEAELAQVSQMLKQLLEQEKEKEKSA